jgi:hypothetical protein
MAALTHSTAIGFISGHQFTLILRGLHFGA